MNLPPVFLEVYGAYTLKLTSKKGVPKKHLGLKANGMTDALAKQ